jgi:hypothetical protein
MSDSSDSRLDRTLDQLDLAQPELLRDHGQVPNLDAFRRHLANASGPHPAPSSPRITDPRPAVAETQLKHALDLAFADLGGAAFALAHHGSLKPQASLYPRPAHPRALRTTRRARPHDPVGQPDHNTPAAHAATA